MAWRSIWRRPAGRHFPARGGAIALGPIVLGAIALGPIVLGAIAWAMLLSGCLPPQASYDFGLGTSRITGNLQLAASGAVAADLPGGALIVVYSYHHQFVTRPDGSPIVTATAQVLRPGPDGAFSFGMPADVVRVEVLFIAPGHLSEVFRFGRQLGVGDVDYRATLREIPDWRDHYYTYLSPQLQDLVVEPRYRLAPAGQQRLAEWLQVQNERLAVRKGNS